MTSFHLNAHLEKLECLLSNPSNIISSFEYIEEFIKHISEALNQVPKESKGYSCQMIDSVYKKGISLVKNAISLILLASDESLKTSQEKLAHLIILKIPLDEHIFCAMWGACWGPVARYLAKQNNFLLTVIDDLLVKLHHGKSKL